MISIVGVVMMFWFLVLNGDLRTYILAGAAFLVGVEFLYIWFLRTFKRIDDYAVHTFLVKIAAILSAVLVAMMIVFLVTVGMMIVEYWKEILFTAVVVVLVYIYFYLNYLLAKKYSVDAKHTHNFKPGDKLKCKQKYDKRQCREDNLSLASNYTYEFVKNSDFDRIKVKSLDKRSCWVGKTRTFRDSYFRKAK